MTKYRGRTVYGWLLLFYAMTFIIGFYLAIPFFMTLFLTIESRLRPLYAAGVTAAAGLPLYIIFRLVLDIPLGPESSPGSFQASSAEALSRS